MPPIFSSSRIIPTGAVDAEVRADADLAEPGGAVVGGERGRAGTPRRARRAPRPRGRASKRSVDPLDRHAARARRDRVADRALGGVLERAGEDLAGGHVALAVGVDPGAARRRAARRSVPSASMRSSLAPREPLDQPRLRVVQLAPGGDRVVAVEEQRALDERGEVAGRHARLLRAGRRRPHRPAPAPLHRQLAQRLPRARRARQPRRVDARQLARVLGRHGCAAGSPSPRCRRARRARGRRGGRRAPPPSSPRSGRAATPACAGHASRSRISRWSASSSGAACVVERTSTCCPGCTSRQ